MKKIWVGLALTFSYILAVGLFFTNMMMYIKKRTDEEILERETLDGHFIQKDFDELEKLEVTIPSEYGYDVKGYLVAPYENRKFVIICHGVTVNRYNSVKYMNLFLNRGFNVLIYDHRRHGESGGKTTSYGHYEKYDLRSAVHWLKEKYGQDITLGIHGESMGSVTMLLYAGMLEDGADFYVADCPFHSLEDQLLYRLKVDYRLPGFFVMPVARPFLKWRDGYSLRDVSPIAVVDQIKKPLLFIHSKKDAYIPADSSRQLFEKKTGPKKIYFAENGDHAMSFTENRAEYERVLDEFLEEIGLAEKQEAYKEKR